MSFLFYPLSIKISFLYTTELWSIFHKITPSKPSELGATFFFQRSPRFQIFLTYTGWHTTFVHRPGDTHEIQRSKKMMHYKTSRNRIVLVITMVCQVLQRCIGTRLYRFTLIRWPTMSGMCGSGMFDGEIPMMGRFLVQPSCTQELSQILVDNIEGWPWT